MTISLNGQWLLACVQRNSIQDIAISFPGDVHSALLDVGIIPEPYWADNEAKVQWVSECDWVVSRHFELTEDDIACKALDLVLDNLDTVAEIRVNGHSVADFQNMFMRHKVNILPCLLVGNNRIEIVLHRADIAAKNRADRLPFPIPWAVGNNQIPHMNTLRKTQCHTGWDWGLCLSVIGIYGDILLQPIQQVRVSHVSTEQHWDDWRCDLEVTIHYESIPNSGLASASVSFDGQTYHLALDQTSTQSTVLFRVDHPKRWWPAGYGKQRLYDLQVVVNGYHIEKKIGLRKLELCTEDDDIGQSMVFKVNDVPISAKGANWIPMDALPSRINDQRYRQLLEDAVAANMNMLRVWGGGMYEKDIFYQLCDELGLLVWQDLMFACALYPSTPDFITEVQAEVEFQVRRLKDHPSMALWCGDNEVIGAIGWYPESRENREKYVVNYDRLNRALSETVTREDPSRRFWASSPCNGELDFGDAWHDDHRGDMHFWDVWHSGKDLEEYRSVTPRFCSEFGFQSWPSLPTVRTFAPEKDWNITSPSFESHQKNARGNSIITEMFTRYFRFPNGFANMLYVSQVQQALAIKTASEYWRAQKPVNRGILYWQLNDCWPVSSWSSLEYSGRWKQLHYHARRFFAPQLAAFVPNDGGVVLHLINDSRKSAELKGEVVWQSWQGEILYREPISQYLEPDKNIVAWQWLAEDLQQHEADGFFHVHLTCGQEVIENTYFPLRPKHCELAAPELRYEVADINNQLYVMLNCEHPAFFVHLEYAGEGRFDDSSFTLVSEYQKQVKYLGPATYEELVAGLTVYHLHQSYQP
ncbi:glycoside hydrolase family 2 protein [Photobacterium profundum]|uniref:Beta-mannosidase B n=1 Tax=Photobacterium profundum 3TCK TaxID=314280 RepID=Q1Z4W6_9GAMM|nr:glycoside hydrolase family 2 protein [Photobacterium profundum]EAS43505.1 putative beta-mannosidase precursor [Photobacterium profundum 3TCK]PSV60247.1 glycoside hydrolase family 2 protein [Photobacterium profundum]